MEFENLRAYLAANQSEQSAGAGEQFSQAAAPQSSAQAQRSVRAPIVPVILSGGGGSRLWPFSTNETPKQFLPLIGARSLFQETLARVQDRLGYASPIVVGSLRHADLCERELVSEAGGACLILEPCARNTAPAIVMAAIVARETHGDDALILVMPSDHRIEDVAAFHEAVRKGEEAARAGRLVTFGIRPTSPDTGYGYLQMGEEIAEVPGVLEVASFVEKPQLELAKRMVAADDHLWNAGIFLFRAGTLLEEVMLLAPTIGFAASQALAAGKREGIRITADAEALENCPSESIDYAVMENSSRVAVVPMCPGWSDLGSWDALAALIGTEDPIGPITALDCDSCYIHSDGVQVAALGVRDLIIVAAGQRLLILPRGRSQEVKKLLSAMDSMAA